MQLLLSNFENHTTTSRDTHTQNHCKYGELAGSLQTLTSKSNNHIQIVLCLQRFYRVMHFTNKHSYLNLLPKKTQLWAEFNFPSNTSCTSRSKNVSHTPKSFCTCAGKVNKELKVQTIQCSISWLLTSAYESYCVWRCIFDCRNTRHMQGFCSNGSSGFCL